MIVFTLCWWSKNCGSEHQAHEADEAHPHSNEIYCLKFKKMVPMKQHRHPLTKCTVSDRSPNLRDTLNFQRGGWTGEIFWVRCRSCVGESVFTQNGKAHQTWELMGICCAFSVGRWRILLEIQFCISAKSIFNKSFKRYLLQWHFAEKSLPMNSWNFCLFVRCKGNLVADLGRKGGPLRSFTERLCPPPGLALPVPVLQP